MLIRRGISLSDAVREAERYGCTFEIKRRTGEYLLRSPLTENFVGNARRKDAPAALISYLRRLKRAKEQQ